MRKARKGIWAIAAIPAVYAASYGATRFVQQHQLYVPGPDHILVTPSAELALPVERVEMRTSDSLKLVGWVIPGQRTASADSTMWMLLCHGNSGHIALSARLRYYKALRQVGVNILAFDYRGFGESEGEPTEDGLYRDADAAYRYLREVRGIPASHIIIYGHSLGSAVAVDLASRVPAAGMIVEGAFTSITDLAQELYPWAPVRWLPVSRFASIDKIGRVRAPKLVLHATADRRIPVMHGRRLYAKANGIKKIVELRGGHGDAFEVDSARYFGAIARFVSDVANPAVLGNDRNRSLGASASSHP